MIDQNPSIMNAANTQLRRAAFFTVIAGIIFTIFGAWMDFDANGLPGILFVILGIAFALRGILGYSRGSRYPASQIAPGQDADA